MLELQKSKKPTHITYKLPDGNTIEVGMERFIAPEVLFRPDLIGEEYPGIHEAINNSIQKVSAQNLLILRCSLWSGFSSP